MIINCEVSFVKEGMSAYFDVVSGIINVIDIFGCSCIAYKNTVGGVIVKFSVTLAWFLCVYPRSKCADITYVRFLPR